MIRFSQSLFRHSLKLTAGNAAPTRHDRSSFEKSCVKYLKREGWRMEQAMMHAYHLECGTRRIVVIFFPDHRAITDTHILDWNSYRLRAGLRTFVFSQADPHQAYVDMAAERKLTLRSYLDVAILSLSDEDRLAEQAVQKARRVR